MLSRCASGVTLGLPRQTEVVIALTEPCTTILQPSTDAVVDELTTEPGSQRIDPLGTLRHLLTHRHYRSPLSLSVSTHPTHHPPYGGGWVGVLPHRP